MKEIVSKNRSYRRFDHSRKIEKEQLLSLVELARLCPSAANMQPLRYHLISDTSDCAKLFPHLKWAGYLRYWDGPVDSERPVAYIVILSPANTTRFHQIDTGIVAQTMLLGATEMSFGGCMLASMDKEAIRAAFVLPAELDISLVIALGYPAETVVIEEVTDPEDIEYWRDDEGLHHVPKRAVRDLVL